jgi:hypothetical protein
MNRPTAYRAFNGDGNAHRQPYHRPHTSMGMIGHWMKTAGILAPVVISELIKDPDRKWRAIRLASVGTALLSEAIWTSKILSDRETACSHDSGPTTPAELVR